MTFRTRGGGDSGSYTMAGSFDDGADSEYEQPSRAYKPRTRDDGGDGHKKRKPSGNARKGNRTWASASTATLTPTLATASASGDVKALPSLQLSAAAHWPAAAHRDRRNTSVSTQDEDDADEGDDAEVEGDDEDDDDDDEHDGASRRHKRRRSNVRGASGALASPSVMTASGVDATGTPLASGAQGAAFGAGAGAAGGVADERKGQQRHRLRAALGLLSSKLRARLLIGHLGLTKRPFHTRPRSELLQIHHFLVTHFPAEIATRGQIAPDAMERALLSVGAAPGMVHCQSMPCL